MAKNELKSSSCKACSSLECSIFSDLPEKDFYFLDRCKTVNCYKKRQIIFYEGNPVLGLYCIRSGKIKLYKTSAEGKQQILRIVKAGDMLGHSALFSNGPHSTTAEVIEDSDICFLDKNGFLSILRNNPSIAVKLLARLSSELVHTEKKALDLAYKSTRVRLAELLLALKETFGVREEGVDKLNISLSREELAQAVGITVETAVRLLSEFREEGFIGVNKRSISILDSEGLLELIGSGY